MIAGLGIFDVTIIRCFGAVNYGAQLILSTDQRGYLLKKFVMF
jgi:hypothetical protein